VDVLIHVDLVTFNQDISIVVSTEDFRDNVEKVAKTCSASYFVLPSVSSIGSGSEEDRAEDIVLFENILSKVKSISSDLEGNTFYWTIL
jgi:hypothetical protein